MTKNEKLHLSKELLASNQWFIKTKSTISMDKAGNGYRGNVCISSNLKNTIPSFMDEKEADNASR